MQTAGRVLSFPCHLYVFFHIPWTTGNYMKRCINSSPSRSAIEISRQQSLRYSISYYSSTSPPDLPQRRSLLHFITPLSHINLNLLVTLPSNRHSSRCQASPINSQRFTSTPCYKNTQPQSHHIVPHAFITPSHPHPLPASPPTP